MVFSTVSRPGRTNRSWHAYKLRQLVVLNKTRFTLAVARRFTQTITMTAEQPENKKRKVYPEPEAGIPPVSNLLIKRLSEKAKLPTRGSALAAGYDLYR